MSVLIGFQKSIVTAGHDSAGDEDENNCMKYKLSIDVPVIRNVNRSPRVLSSIRIIDLENIKTFIVLNRFMFSRLYVCQLFVSMSLFLLFLHFQHMDCQERINECYRPNFPNPDVRCELFL